MRKKLPKLFVSAATSAAQMGTKTPGIAPPPEVAEAAELTTGKKLVQARHFVLSSSSLAFPGGAKKTEKPCPSVSQQVLRRLNKAAVKRAQIKHSPAGEHDPKREITREVCSILRADSDNKAPPSSDHNDGMLLGNILDMRWDSSISQACSVQLKKDKDMSRDRKQRYVFHCTESRRFTKLMRICANNLGTESTLNVFDKFGRVTSLKDYNALIKLCIARAREGTNEDSLAYIHNLHQLFGSMRERGIQIEEESFGPYLELMIEKGMLEEFQIFTKLIKDVNPQACSRIGYYEMLLWIKLGDEDKIQELYSSLAGTSREDDYSLAESYLLAFCDSDRMKELKQLLEVIDVRKISSEKYISSIFKSLGRLQLADFMKKIVLVLKTQCDEEKKRNLSSFIYDFATCIPNLEVEEVVTKFSMLHEQLGVLPSIGSCEMLIKLCCNSSKVSAAIDVVDLLGHFALDVPVEFFHPLLHACEQNFEFDLVRPIFSVMQRLNLKPEEVTFKSMISSSVRMKDFEGAYKLLTYAKEINKEPTASMYNALMAGFFREKNVGGALKVLMQMEAADIEPDSETYTYLIANSESKEEVFKYRDQMRLAGVQSSKHIYMALINAYAKFGDFDMAKQVILDPEVQSKYLNEIKSVLVSALSSNGQVLDALHLYDEIKQGGGSIEHKALISLIEHLQSEGELDRLLQFLEELDGSSSWPDGCSRVVLYCVRYNILNSAVDLLKMLKKKDEISTYIVIDQIFSQIWESEPTNLEIGLELLHAIKEELHIHPSRTSLDFLLSSCVKVKDLKRARLVWSQYEDAGLPYNIMTFLRMFQALLASGEQKAALKLLKKIPKNDPHVTYIINSSRAAFMMPTNQAR